jgi:hypothetical protein
MATQSTKLNDLFNTFPSYIAVESEPIPQELQGRLWWRISHFVGFFTGGFTFILGTLCYYYPNWEAGAFVAAVLYTVGSCGFLYVDVLEYFTFTENKWLRLNILFSAAGSFLYVVGSMGFLPVVYNSTPFFGESGFILLP